MKSVRKKVVSQVVDQFWNQVRGQFGVLVIPVRDQVKEQVSGQFGVGVWNQFRLQVGNQVVNEIS